MRNNTILKLAFTGYIVVTIWVSLTPINQPTVLSSYDKIGHFLTYCGLALLACLAFPSRNGKILALLFSFGLGVVLEGIQATVPGRNMSLLDGLANSLGIVTGIIIYYFQRETCKRWLHL
ncbi:MAG: VanZ family protein [Anaerolineae bacterium]|nr:VanZ family protein [Anaerolineae bacterium]